jgi:hypothetical protein
MDRYEDLNGEGYVETPKYIIRLHDHVWGSHAIYANPKEMIFDIARKLGHPVDWLEEVRSERWSVEVGPGYDADPTKVGMVNRSRIGSTLDCGGSPREMLDCMKRLAAKIGREGTHH